MKRTISAEVGKGSVDHKVNDNWSAGISFNLATSLKASGSKNAVNNAFLMAPIMMARYKEDAADGSCLYYRLTMHNTVTEVTEYYYDYPFTYTHYSDFSAYIILP